MTPRDFLALRSPANADFNEDKDSVESGKPDDPARIATAIMLGDAFERAGRSIDEAGADGVVVFLVPNANWTIPMRDQ